ncbi:DUF5687 family protein [Formosa sp. PL04]|uniref:DUF5687 family protein n=1 Tax=Formosa sp. PL04 TaxID=3081755 RepID=UPI00298119A0|nr:DUF5687 family protein [Formosa sp. PL04]MDW5289021.1 DUF5687 family protein [Formosa sp. PL04]
MIKHFLSLEWKQFSRAAYFKKGIFIKIILAIVVLYFSVIAVALGAGIYYILEKQMPDSDPLVVVNNFLIYWFLFDIVFRFFMQQLPVINVKPLMLLPVKRSKVIHFLLGKTVLSFFNILPLLMFVPFVVVLIINGYPVGHVLLWLLGIICITLSINFTNFLINKNNIVFYAVVSVLAVLIGLEYYGVYRISEPIGLALNAMYTHMYLVVIPFLACVGLYILNFKYIRSGFYLDNVVSKKVKEVQTTDLSWFDRFGTMGPFLKNDIKLIWRNKRPKQVLMMAFMFLFYGVIFFTNKSYEETPAILAFAAMFVTGGFLISFGQLIPSWDSEYYKLLMSQNIQYKTYLESKWYLLSVAVLISFVLSTPYLYFGWKTYGMIAAGASFNIGLNSYITLFGGALNRTPVELNVKAKAFSNMQGFNPTQMLIAIPKLVLPMLLFYLPYKLINFNAGIIVLGVSGILGVAFKGFFLNLIEKVYQKGKYKTIAAYSEKN